jgi:hypothetical protein
MARSGSAELVVASDEVEGVGGADVVKQEALGSVPAVKPLLGGVARLKLPPLTNVAW